MQAFQIAERPGSVRAPQGFIEALRREVRDPGLDVWWDPEAATYAQHPRDRHHWDPSPREDGRGCWVVWKQVRTLEQVEIGGQTVGLVRKKYVDVYKLDGLYGQPMTLGPWVAKVLNESDATKRGNADRNKRLDDVNEQSVLAEFKESNDFARDFAKDSFVKRIFQRAVEERGAPMLDREDRMKMERAAAKRAERQARRAERQAKAMRLRGTA